MVVEWRFEPGDLTSRSEVSELYGGAKYGGIEPSAKTPNVMLYSDPSQGKRHGYDFDGWSPHEPHVYFYTGAGQVGDQDPHRTGNGAILRHVEAGRSLRLFEARGPNLGGGKPQVYIGEFYLDSNDPWRYEDAPDSRGAMRKVVVFRLIATDPAVSRHVSHAEVVARRTTVHQPDSAPLRTPAEPAELRALVMEWLASRTNDGAEPLRMEDLTASQNEGLPVSVASSRGPVWAPPGFGGALSLRSSVEDPNELERSRNPDLLEFPLPPDSTARRPIHAAASARLPLVWLQSVGGGYWLPVFPVYVASESDRGFLLAPDELYGLTEGLGRSPAEDVLRRYIKAETKRRLHQPVFRARVLRAYDRKCAICALAHPKLLDAAHIVDDSHELGIAAVRNGIAMCKLHHSAYDSHYLGITPDLEVRVANRVLEEVDGPTLLHGLQGRHCQPLMVVPSLVAERPDPDLLAFHYEQFVAAAV